MKSFLILLLALAAPARAEFETALFAGGCFWCMESPFEGQPGVIEVKAGYTGGTVVNPKYEQVGMGKTGHREAVQVVFDSKKISYQQLLNIFWCNIDPTDKGGQFADRGESYQTAIYTTSKEQKAQAEESRLKLDKSGAFDKPIVTEILDAKPFYAAEDYHQDYYKKNPGRYKVYKAGSGREGFLKNSKLHETCK